MNSIKVIIFDYCKTNNLRKLTNIFLHRMDHLKISDQKCEQLGNNWQARLRIISNRDGVQETVAQAQKMHEVKKHSIQALQHFSATGKFSCSIG